MIKAYQKLSLCFFIFLLVALSLPNAHALTLMQARKIPLGELELFGIPYQGGWLKGTLKKGETVKFLGKNIITDKNGRFILGLPYKAKTELMLEYKNKAGKIYHYKIAVKPRIYNVQRIEGIDPKKITPPESELPRIAREGKMVAKARRKGGNYQGFDQRFIWPVIGRISGIYGSRRFYNGIERSPHYGIDIAAQQGVKVVAPAEGRIVLIHRDMYFSGGTIIIDHGNQLFSNFLHLQSIKVKQGSWVQQGMVIGTVGSTGRATGPHLDWRINWGKERLDSALFVPPMPNIQKNSSVGRNVGGK